MKRIRKSTYLPILLFLAGTAFYVYYGIEYNAWMQNLWNIIIYLVIIVALFFTLRKKEQYEDERRNSQ